MKSAPSPYPAYRPSGIKWLDKVPEHWELPSVKQCYEVQLGKMLQPNRLSEDDREIPYLKALHVQWFAVNLTPPSTMWANPRDIEQFSIKEGDLLVCEGGEGGRAGIVKSDLPGHIIQNALHRVRPTDGSLNEYLLYALFVVSSIGWLNAVNNKATIAHFTREKLAALRIPLPPLQEQRAIVRYLDYVDRRVRRYVGAKRRLIALLEEEKQAVVNRAVTRGLDPNVRLKPSGVEWLGDVPEHWEVVQLGRIGIFSKGSGGTKEDEVPEGILCVRYGDLYTTHKYFVNQARSFVSIENASAYTPIARGDVLFPTSGETIEEIGKSAVNLMHPPVVCGGDLIIFRPTISIEPKFAGYALDCHVAQTQKSLMGRGITIMHIYSAQLKYLWFLLPPLPEQQSIVRQIDQETARIDAAIARARHQIELVQEYRNRLIADVVTGKLDVREAAAQLPEEAEEDEPIDGDGPVADNENDGLFELNGAIEEELAAESEVGE